MSRPRTELERLADLYDVESSYLDVHQTLQRASVESLIAILRVLGAHIDSVSDAPRAIERRQRELADRGIEPVVVTRPGDPLRFSLVLPDREADAELWCSLESEATAGPRVPIRVRPHCVPTGSHGAPAQGFREVAVTIHEPVESGYHRLIVETPSRTLQSQLIAAPTRVYADDARTWGCFLPLYALQSERNWGAGDFTDLANISGWVRELGGRSVGTLPLLAAYLDSPFEPSPYAPVTRSFWNEFYIDVEAIAEFDASTAARQMVSSTEFRRSLELMRAANEVDYRRIMALKREVLELLAAEFFERRPPRFAEYERFASDTDQLRDYAAFRATVERRGEPWPMWPPAARDGELSADDFHPAVARYHSYVQWIAHEQLGRLAAEAADGLYLDLPLGVRADGFDVWRHRSSYISGAAAGAPPDAFFTKGQNWCFPPLDPNGIRQDGYRHARRYLGHHLRLARTLRIDHVMGLHRLFWVPDGMPASEGVYVRYRPDEWYGVLSLESHRYQTTLIGENLGTVPAEVNESLSRHGVRRMFVVQYELEPEMDDQPLGAIPRECIASLNTHDMPTFAAWRQGLDIPLRQELGLLDAATARREKRRLAEMIDALRTWLGQRAWLADERETDLDIFAALIRCLAASDAELVMINLEDLWSETRPQNVPGTGAELPNWKRKATPAFEEFSARSELLELLQSVAGFRSGATPRPVHEGQSDVVSPSEKQRSEKTA